MIHSTHPYNRSSFHSLPFLLSTLALLLICLPTIAQKKVLVEQFTNSGCPNCASNTPVIASYVNANLNSVLMLSYHTPFPYNDSMYYENAYQSDQRVIYSNVGGVPASRVDGNYFSGNLVPTLSTTLMAAATVSPRYSISFSSCELNGNEITASVLFESIDANNISEDLTAQVVVAEKNVLKSSYVCCPGANAENEYPWVVRRMLPDETGTALMNKGLNGMDLVNVNWLANNFKDLQEMRLVAFVQNNSTKEVYQAELSVPVNTTGLFSSPANEKNLFSVITPVNSSFLSIHLLESKGDYQLKVFNTLGQVIHTESISNTAFLQIDISNYQKGIYFVQLSNDKISQINKVLFSN